MYKSIRLVYSINSEEMNLKGKGRHIDFFGQLISIWLKELAMHRKCKLLTVLQMRELGSYFTLKIYIFTFHFLYIYLLKTA